MRSTAKCVLPVLVGPSTATSREGAVPANISFIAPKVADRIARRKSGPAFSPRATQTRRGPPRRSGIRGPASIAVSFSPDQIRRAHRALARGASTLRQRADAGAMTAANLRGGGGVAGLGEPHRVMLRVAEQDSGRGDLGELHVEPRALFREADDLAVRYRNRDRPWMSLAQCAIPAA